MSDSMMESPAFLHPLAQLLTYDSGEFRCAHGVGAEDFRGEIERFLRVLGRQRGYVVFCQRC